MKDDETEAVFVECHICGEHYISNGYSDCPYCLEAEEVTA